MPILKYNSGGGTYVPLYGGTEEVTISPNQPPVNTDLWVDTDDHTGGVPTYGRNVIRNGDMQIAQRGDGPFSGGGTTGIDGWTPYLGGGGTYSLTRSVLTPGFGSRKMVIAVAGQSAAGDYAIIRQRIEDVTTFAGKTVTLSFDAYAASGAPKIALQITQNFGTGGSPSGVVNTFPVEPVALSTTVTRYSLTFAIPSISGKTLGTSGGFLEVMFWLSAGSTHTYAPVGNQNNTFYFTDVQLEEGNAASPFERLPVQQQLAWCQRYYQRIAPFISTASPIASQNTCYVAYLPWPVHMRASPTMQYFAGTVYNGSAGLTFWNSSGASSILTPTATGADTAGVNISTTATYANTVVVTGSLIMSAEL